MAFKDASETMTPPKSSVPPVAAVRAVTSAPVPTGARLPGSPLVEESLQKKMLQALKNKGADYRPRTQHLLAGGAPRYVNRLIFENSPYLLQHAHNPVNWYPWGDDAFAVAKRLQKPVFLSVGYATCHWCHVMEEESFEDEEIAAFLNQHFVCIKVDREERPDIDAVYMAAVQALTGRGGWPMSVWLNDEKQPFFAGTYFPARDGDRGVSVGFLSLLERLKQAYTDDPANVAESASSLADALQSELASKRNGPLPAVQELQKILHEAVEDYRARYDTVWGGLAGAPKFPSSLPIRFLLRYAIQHDNAEVLEMVELTLERMASGGMYDQIGGGFHRYSTDDKWIVPHFEKMLYDNARLLLDYTEAWQLTHKPFYRRIVSELASYVVREMQMPEGGFYSATDADSATPQGPREEGYYFTWTPDEIRAELMAVLPATEATLTTETVLRAYSVTAKGNFEGRSVFWRAPTIDLTPKEEERIQTAKEILYRARSERPAPLRDEKMITAWNGLMISALAKAGFALGNEAWIQSAKRAADWMMRTMRGDKGQLLRIYTQAGQAKYDAVINDYTYLAAGFLDLYEVTGYVPYLKEAVSLHDYLDKHFYDSANGGFYMTSDEAEVLLVREKPFQDSSEPSGNSVAALNLLRLATLTGQLRWQQRAEKTIASVAQILQKTPIAVSEMLLAVDWYLYKPLEVVVIDPNRDEGIRAALWENLRHVFIPRRVVVRALVADVAALSRLVPLLEDRRAINNKTTAYVCTEGVCQLPSLQVEPFVELLQASLPARWRKNVAKN